MSWIDKEDRVRIAAGALVMLLISCVFWGVSYLGHVYTLPITQKVAGFVAMVLCTLAIVMVVTAVTALVVAGAVVTAVVYIPVIDVLQRNYTENSVWWDFVRDMLWVGIVLLIFVFLFGCAQFGNTEEEDEADE